MTYLGGANFSIIQFSPDFERVQNQSLEANEQDWVGWAEMLAFLGFIPLAERINRVFLFCFLYEWQYQEWCVCARVYACMGKQNLMTVTRMSYKVGELAIVWTQRCQFQLRQYKIPWKLSFMRLVTWQWVKLKSHGVVLHSNLESWMDSKAIIQNRMLREGAKANLGLTEFAVFVGTYNWCVHFFVLFCFVIIGS